MACPQSMSDDEIRHPNTKSDVRLCPWMSSEEVFRRHWTPSDVIGCLRMSHDVFFFNFIKFFCFFF